MNDDSNSNSDSPNSNRGLAGDSLAAGKGFLIGVGEGAFSMADGIWSLAKGTYNVATDAAAREQAWDTTKKVAGAVKQYGEASVDDPAKPFRDAKNGTQKLYNSFNDARQNAAAEGQSAEFWGKGIGRGAFEIGSLFIGVGEAGAAAKAGEVAKTAETVVDAAKLTRPAEGVGQTAEAASRVAEIIEKPAIGAADKSINAVVECPLKKIPAEIASEANVIKFTEELNTLSVATDKDKLLLYSGVGKIPGADVTRTANSVIDRTEAGLAIQKYEKELAEAGMNRDEIFSITEPMWRQTSVRLASQAEGNVTVVMGPTVRENAVIYDELNALENNTNVTSVEILKLDSSGKVIAREFR